MKAFLWTLALAALAAGAWHLYRRARTGKFTEEYYANYKAWNEQGKAKRTITALSEIPIATYGHKPFSDIALNPLPNELNANQPTDLQLLPTARKNMFEKWVSYFGNN